jgi:hypothetical protein
MPFYSIRHKKTGEITEHFMGIQEMEEYEKAHPNEEVLCGAPGIGDPARLGRVKPSEDFRDKMRTIKKNHPLGNINVL